MNPNGFDEGSLDDFSYAEESSIFSIEPDQSHARAHGVDSSSIDDLIEETRNSDGFNERTNVLCMSILAHPDFNASRLPMFDGLIGKGLFFKT